MYYSNNSYIKRRKSEENVSQCDEKINFHQTILEVQQLQTNMANFICIICANKLKTALKPKDLSL